MRGLGELNMNEKSNNNEINSEKYWENRFLTGDWEKKEGREQSLFFYETALKFLPDWFVSDIEKNSLSICDLGCAEGEGVKLFGDKFKNSRVVGSDISEAALERAKNHYPDYDIYHNTLELNLIFLLWPAVLFYSQTYFNPSISSMVPYLVPACFLKYLFLFLYPYIARTLYAHMTSAALPQLVSALAHFPE